MPDKIQNSDIKVNIILTDNIPVYERPRRLSPSEKEEVNAQVDEWLRNKIIQRSQSDYASPGCPRKKIRWFHETLRRLQEAEQ